MLLGLTQSPLKLLGYFYMESNWLWIWPIMASSINRCDPLTWSIWHCLSSEATPHGRWAIFCLLQAIVPNLYLIGTYALLKLAFHLVNGQNATLTDGHQCWHAKLPIFASHLSVSDCRSPLGILHWQTLKKHSCFEVKRRCHCFKAQR